MIQRTIKNMWTCNLLMAYYVNLFQIMSVVLCTAVRILFVVSEYKSWWVKMLHHFFFYKRFSPNQHLEGKHYLGQVKSRRHLVKLLHQGHQRLSMKLYWVVFLNDIYTHIDVKSFRLLVLEILGKITIY